jgi:hypothetical protein
MMQLNRFFFWTLIVILFSSFINGSKIYQNIIESKGLFLNDSCLFQYQSFDSIYKVYIKVSGHYIKNENEVVCIIDNLYNSEIKNYILYSKLDNTKVYKTKHVEYLINNTYDLNDTLIFNYISDTSLVLNKSDTLYQLSKGDY